jgi:hypothetical protein
MPAGKLTAHPRTAAGPGAGNKPADLLLNDYIGKLS